MPQPAPSEARIELRFEKFSAFVEGYASNLSLGGLFLETDDLRPVGSIVDFEIKLTDGFRLIQGLGEVIWGRRAPAGDDRPAGLGIRFQALDDEGRELILKILEERVRSGHEPFDVEEIPDDVARGTRAGEEAGDPAPDGAADAPSQQPLDLEKKILGEDGFTLLDTEQPRRDGGADLADKTFEEMSFDAPWGEALPELPQEVLGEEPDGEPAAAAVFQTADAAPDTGPDDGAQRDLDDSMMLAAEAADEIDSAPPSRAALNEPEFDDIDFGVADVGDAPDEHEAAGVDFAFDPDPEDQLPPFEPAPDVLPAYDDPFSDLDEEDATIAGAGAEASDEDPTLASERPAAVAEPEPEVDDPAPPAVAETADDDLGRAFGGGDVTATAMPEPPAPVPSTPTFAASTFAAPRAEPPVAAGGGAGGGAAAPAGMVSVAGATLPVQDYEDDLFAEAPDAGFGQVVRQAFTGRSLIAIVLLLALAGAAYVVRGPLAELAGLSAPPPAAAPPSAAGVPEPAAEAPGQVGDVEPIDQIAVSQWLPPDGATAGDPLAEPGADAPALETAAPELEPPSAPAREPAAVPASRVERIAWRRDGQGTRVTLILNGRLDDDHYAYLPLGYEPAREMIKLIGIDEPYVSGRIEVGSPEVAKIRVGHHTRPDGADLHVVFDYPGAGPRVVTVRNLGDRLEVLIRDR